LGPEPLTKPPTSRPCGGLAGDRPWAARESDSSATAGAHASRGMGNSCGANEDCAATYPAARRRGNVPTRARHTAGGTAACRSALRRALFRVVPTMHAADRLLAIVDRAEKTLAAVPQTHAQSAPAPGRWSAVQILGHLLDSAVNNHQRFVRA